MEERIRKEAEEKARQEYEDRLQRESKEKAQLAEEVCANVSTWHGSPYE